MRHGRQPLPAIFDLYTDDFYAAVESVSELVSNEKKGIAEAFSGD